jgi:hypothetical protein
MSDAAIDKLVETARLAITDGRDPRLAADARHSSNP